MMNSQHKSVFKIRLYWENLFGCMKTFYLAQKIITLSAMCSFMVLHFSRFREIYTLEKLKSAAKIRTEGTTKS